MAKRSVDEEVNVPSLDVAVDFVEAEKEDVELDRPSVQVEQRRDPRVETTASKVGYLVLSILAGTILLHYILLSIAAARGSQELANSISEVYQTTLPVLAGLSGSVATYYFTKGK